jgi:hypothetical protein
LAGPESNVVVCHLNWILNLSLMSLVTWLVSRFMVGSDGEKTVMTVLPSAVVSFAAPSADLLELQAAVASARTAASAVTLLRVERISVVSLLERTKP